MITKLFEVRDAGTFIPVIATRLMAAVSDYNDNVLQAEEYLIRRAGFSSESDDVFLARLTDFKGCYDPSMWEDKRTMLNAHKYIKEHWEELRSGSVVDVEFILGESKEPKQSERTSNSLWAGVYNG
jgi:hypothetical protein